MSDNGTSAIATLEKIRAGFAALQAELEEAKDEEGKANAALIAEMAENDKLRAEIKRLTHVVTEQQSHIDMIRRDNVDIDAVMAQNAEVDSLRAGTGMTIFGKPAYFVDGLEESIRVKRLQDELDQMTADHIHVREIAHGLENDLTASKAEKQRWELLAIDRRIELDAANAEIMYIKSMNLALSNKAGAANARIAELEAELDAADACAIAQDGRIAELENARRWVPVGERLPDDSNPVLAYGYSLWTAHYVKSEWYDDVMDERIYITHWQPLPAAPEASNA